MLVKNNKLQLSTEQRCAMLESNYERLCFINLSAAEKRTSQGDKTLKLSLWLICIESIILRKISSTAFRGLFWILGVGACFVSVWYAVFKGLNYGCEVAMSTWTALFKVHRDKKRMTLLFPGEQEKAPVKSARPNLSEFLMKERMHQVKPRSLPSLSLSPLRFFSFRTMKTSQCSLLACSALNSLAALAEKKAM